MKGGVESIDNIGSNRTLCYFHPISQRNKAWPERAPLLQQKHKGRLLLLLEAISDSDTTVNEPGEECDWKKGKGPGQTLQVGDTCRWGQTLACRRGSGT